jgi:hypothetical protein
MMQFIARPPSSTWEPIPLADDPTICLWAWFRPPAAPHGVIVRFPEEAFRGPAQRIPLTMRRILAAVAVDPRQVGMWTVYGAAFDPQQGASPALDFPIPEPGAAGDPTVGIYLTLPAPVAPPSPVPQGLSQGGSLAERFQRMEGDWNFSLQLEQQLAAAAKQLNATLLRINSLNRDLSSDEGRAADQLDKHEWQDARRALRDVASRLSRFLKDHHVGMTSTAGRRGAFEAIYMQYVVPRRNFDGLSQAEREFELYRKTMQTLLNNMNTAQTAAVQEGERRAQQILSRISSKVRSSRTKHPGRG